MLKKANIKIASAEVLTQITDDKILSTKLPVYIKNKLKNVVDKPTPQATGGGGGCGGGSRKRKLSRNGQ